MHIGFVKTPSSCAVFSLEQTLVYFYFRLQFLFRSYDGDEQLVSLLL